MKATIYEFKVRGTGRFPLDMLRYDRCWPAHEAADSKAISDSFYGRSDVPVRQITLRGLVMPTLGRWLSFGWRVDDVVVHEK